MGDKSYTTKNKDWLTDFPFHEITHCLPYHHQVLSPLYTCTNRDNSYIPQNKDRLADLPYIGKQ